MTATALRNSTANWQAFDAAHHLHPFTDHAELAKIGTRIITRAEGSHLIDSEGNRLLDAFAGLWCVNVGYGRKELAKAAYDQMLQLPYYNTFFKTATPPAVELGSVLAGLTSSTLAPTELKHVFYGLSGSDANDTIARMVRQYWNLVGKTAKKTIISRTNGYHGSTMVAASLGGMSYMHQHADLPLPGFVHIPQPYWYGEGGDLSPEAFGLKAAGELEKKILELGPERCAAFIGEPIQGAGGVIMPPATYWPEIQRICRQYDLLLIADEVICGFGRTGHWFASELYGIKADFMTLAKGLTSGYVPLSAAMIGSRVADVLIASGEFDHGFTYSGHPVSCAVAIENIRILKEEKLIERVHNETGPYLEKRLKELLDHPLVGEVRLKGFIGAIELVKDKKTRAVYQPQGEVGTICRDHCFAIGLVMRATRDTMLISPPLSWTKAEIDEFLMLTRKALDVTLADVKRRFS
jgi:putrescine aminotransferase